MMSGIDARWHGLNSTLIIPHMKHPKAATAVPPAIHWFTVKKNDSIMTI
jgi:hypothetical protein